MRLYWTSSHLTESTQHNVDSSTMHSHPFNAMSHAYACHCMLYHATCIMNATWTMPKPYTSPCTMDNHILCIQFPYNHIFHVNIFIHTYINILSHNYHQACYSKSSNNTIENNPLFRTPKPGHIQATNRAQTSPKQA